MNTGGRRRPLGPRLRGLSGCALVFAVLSLWLGAAAGRSLADGHHAPSMTQAVAIAHVVVKPPMQDVSAVPAEIAVVAMVLGCVLIRARRTASPVRIRREHRQGRAPPDGPEHR